LHWKLCLYANECECTCEMCNGHVGGRKKAWKRGMNPRRLDTSSGNIRWVDAGASQQT
jgi:hypothetical protein